MSVTIERVMQSYDPRNPLTRGEVRTLLRDSYFVAGNAGPAGHAEEHIDGGDEGRFDREAGYVAREAHSVFIDEDDAVTGLYLAIGSAAGRYAMRRLQNGQWQGAAIHVAALHATRMRVYEQNPLFGLLHVEADCRSITAVIRLHGHLIRRLHVQTVFPRDDASVLSRQGANVDSVASQTPNGETVSFAGNARVGGAGGGGGDYGLARLFR
ncbi:hypothetical protein [Polyangium jinanense]|uniref:Uncharacterized protein n=1 Tax=Polyangium jinanense TaxID=2829994 RepID=A0A9X4ASS4_9BACT|nr:hypothetical protein [Polyangium jinanense]MDC3958231.1 hypothetical protein [Polyangium jinanense]MDC3983434.1 hypothetical protein [Polyangium jinanense]